MGGYGVAVQFKECAVTVPSDLHVIQMCDHRIPADEGHIPKHLFIKGKVPFEILHKAIPRLIPTHDLPPLLTGNIHIFRLRSNCNVNIKYPIAFKNADNFIRKDLTADNGCDPRGTV